MQFSLKRLLLSVTSVALAFGALRTASYGWAELPRIVLYLLAPTFLLASLSFVFTDASARSIAEACFFLFSVFLAAVLIAVLANQVS